MLKVKVPFLPNDPFFFIPSPERRERSERRERWERRKRLGAAGEAWRGGIVLPLHVYY